jgi:23S rRNA (cytidine2498-2'-O)-methyltransferase
VRTIARPAEMISYAYLKMQEALRWSRLPVRAGQRCAELGCAPGGAAQALLEHGLEVLGIDPAEVDPRLVEDPGFTHLQMRVRDVRRRTFRKIKWLFSDMNVAPRYALDAVEGVVLYPQVQLRGMLLTLKLPRWSVADDLEEYLGRIRGWGFEHVVARQLPHFRQEVCVAAMRKRPQRNRRRKHERRTSAQAITPASDVGSDA